MTDSSPPRSIIAPKAEFDALASQIISGEVSLIELMRSPPPGDYRAHVDMIRLTRVLFRVPGIQAALLREMEAIRPPNLSVADDDSIEREVTRKDGQRRFKKLVDYKSNAQDGTRVLLTGDDFQTCLAQYTTLIMHVEWLWSSATKVFVENNAPLSAFLAILTIEAIGKLTNLWEELVWYDMPVSPVATGGVDRSHRRKHFVAAASGAIINARLDRVLGKNTVRRLLHEAESDELEKIRQSCLYIDVRDGELLTPQQMVGADRAQTLVVFAGELMAEILGHFPWEWQRMIENVIAFEREIGMPEEKINQK